MRIGIDVDGVLAQFEPHVAKAALRLGMEITTPPTQWNYNLSEADLRRLLDETFSTYNLWLESPENEENCEALYTFLGMNPYIEVYYVTARAETPGMLAERQTREWLDSRGLYAENCTVLRVEHAAQKEAIFRGIGIQYSIDDYHKTAAALSTIEGHTAFLLNQPWNRNEQVPMLVQRVETLAEYLSVVEAAYHRVESGLR